MYNTAPIGRVAVGAATPSTLAELRTAITALTFPSPLLTLEQKLRANHNVHDCTDPARLLRWLANVNAALARP